MRNEGKSSPLLGLTPWVEGHSLYLIQGDRVVQYCSYAQYDGVGNVVNEE